MKKSIYFAIIFCLSDLAHASAQDRPLPPREAAVRMTLPDGFKATLFAGEPDVVQPIAMCFDSRGRLWVAECMSYPNWHTNPKEGKDRILIFEDTDNDGVFDKRTVFADKLANVTALQVGFGGVFVGATPHLLFIPDKNGDDIPDGPPEILLDGFDIKAGHTVMNSLTWGPDGWLYGNHGIQATVKLGKPGTPADKRAVLNCGVWRYHPVRKEVEAFAHGTTNPWGLDFDETGQMFITNCVIGHLWHVVPGAHFERMYGQDLNPSVYGLMQTCADHIHWGGGAWTTSRALKDGPKDEHSVAGGGHAHVGCMVYLGDNFPDRYRNTVFMCNLHGNRINNDILERKGSTYVARHGKDFMFANDPWFRGIALCYGPDGGVYVSDWTDTGECHNYKVADKTNGRIFKITYGKAKNPAETKIAGSRKPRGKNWDLSNFTDGELLSLLENKNQWYARTARRILQERAATGRLAKNTRAILESNVLSLANEPHSLSALWALHVTGGIDPKITDQLLSKNAGDYLRAWAIRLAFERPSNREHIERFQSGELWRLESSAIARLELASAAQRVGPDERVIIASGLSYHGDDAQDPYLPLMYWYALEPLVSKKQAFGKEESKAFADGFVYYLRYFTSIPVIRENVARCLAQQNDIERLGILIGKSDVQGDPTYYRDLLRGIHAGLQGRRQVAIPKEWVTCYPQLIASPLPEVRDLAISLAVQFGDKRAFTTLEKIVADKKETNAKRQAALDTLLFQQKSDLVPVLQGLLSDGVMRSAALKGLARFDDAKTPELILKGYADYSDEEKIDAVTTLTSRPAFAQALLVAMEKKLVPGRDVSAFNARQIQALGNKEITDRLAKVWGTIRPASEDKAVLLTKYKTALTAANLKKANLSNGRQLYQKNCAACHRLFGAGNDIGPDLTGSQRSNLDYILENIIDPSAIVAKDYQVTVFETKDGRVILGIIKQETDKAVTVQTQNERIVLPLGDIASRKQSPLSMMPEGQLNAMTMTEARDLVGYLGSPMQVPLPTGK
jgi:putative membrane-bound dehydrogenase-like protein